MKRLGMTALLVAALASLLPSQGDAGHRNRGGNCAPPPDCGAPCASGPYASAPVAAPQFVEQTVTRYQTRMVEREVTEVIHRQVPRQEKFQYTVQVPENRVEKRVQTVLVPVQREVEFKYTVQVPV